MPYYFKCPPEKKIRIIAIMASGHKLSDLFAAAHYVMTPGFEVKALIGGSCQRVVELMDESGCCEVVSDTSKGPEDFVIRGAEYLVKEALREDGRPIYVCVWGNLNLIPAAYAMEPEIAEKITVIWMDDGESVDSVVRDTLIPFWVIPASACQKVRVTMAQLYQRVRPYGMAGKFLYDQAVHFNTDNSLNYAQGESVVLEAQAAIAVLTAPHDYACEYKAAGSRSVRVYNTVDNRFLLEDFFAKLALREPSLKKVKGGDGI